MDERILNSARSWASFFRTLLHPLSLPEPDGRHPAHFQNCPGTPSILSVARSSECSERWNFLSKMILCPIFSLFFYWFFLIYFFIFFEPLNGWSDASYGFWLWFLMIRCLSIGMILSTGSLRNSEVNNHKSFTSVIIWLPFSLKLTCEICGLSNNWRRGNTSTGNLKK